MFDVQIDKQNKVVIHLQKSNDNAEINVCLLASADAIIYGINSVVAYILIV
jgi:hypothetical protein